MNGIDADQCSQVEREGYPLLANTPSGPVLATLILAHGAGAPMDSPFMEQITQALALQGIAVLRFEFPYMQRRRQEGGRRPPDRQPVLLACWREVFSRVRPQVAGPLLIGGKSMGGRMASLLVDELEADGLVCLGYPFHPPAKPEALRVAHLQELQSRALIIQGERDPFGRRDEVVGYGLAPTIELQWLEQADHDLKPLKSTGISHGQHIQTAAQAVRNWWRQEEIG